MVVLGKTRHGEMVEINTRAAESDLVIYVNINFVPMDGGHKSVAVGLCGYEASRRTTRRKAIVDSQLVSWIRRASRAAPLGRAHRPASSSEHIKVFHIETALNNRMFDGPLAFLMKNEDDFTETDRLKFQAMKWTLVEDAARAAPRDLHARAGAATS